MTDHRELPVDRQWLCERIVDQAGEAVLFADTDETILLWNDAAAEIFGYSREEAIGSQLEIIIPEEYIDAHHRGYAEALERTEVTSPPVTRTRSRSTSSPSSESGHTTNVLVRFICHLSMLAVEE